MTVLNMVFLPAPIAPMTTPAAAAEIVVDMPRDVLRRSGLAAQRRKRRFSFSVVTNFSIAWQSDDLRLDSWIGLTPAERP